MNIINYCRGIVTVLYKIFQKISRDSIDKANSCSYNVNTNICSYGGFFMRSIKRSNLTQKTIAVVASIITCAVLALIINASTLTVRADETQDYTYKSIKIVNDDTLWSIAKEYCPKSVSMNDYMNMVRETNGISTEHIVEGNYLLIPVFN